ncbi:hypothetical protein M3Y94_00042200 [Aphelenchoides besseyi]|nr:hypothetical protein M3Y94_00042200 [Aphelenchoides besseyi]
MKRFWNTVVGLIVLTCAVVESNDCYKQVEENLVRLNSSCLSGETKLFVSGQELRLKIKSERKVKYKRDYYMNDVVLTFGNCTLKKFKIKINPWNGIYIDQWFMFPMEFRVSPHNFGVYDPFISIPSTKYIGDCNVNFVEQKPYGYTIDVKHHFDRDFDDIQFEYEAHLDENSNSDFSSEVWEDEEIVKSLPLDRYSFIAPKIGKKKVPYLWKDPVWRGKMRRYENEHGR